MRNATITDLPRIVEIYNAAIPGRLATADLEPVTVESRQAWFEKHPQGYIMVEERAGTVVGWVSFEDFYGRPAYSSTKEISIYLAPEVLGQGLGRQVLEAALDQAAELGIRRLVGYIFSHNAPSIALFKSFGFKLWGELPQIAEMDGQEYSLSILGLKLV